MNNSSLTPSSSGDRVVGWRVAVTHHFYLLVNIAVAADRATHDADFVAGEFDVWISDCRSNAVILVSKTPYHKVLKVSI